MTSRFERRLAKIEKLQRPEPRALGRIVLAKRERVIALEPHEKGLIGTTLHYPYEVRNSKDYFADIPELTPAPAAGGVPAPSIDIKTQSANHTFRATGITEHLWAHRSRYNTHRLLRRA
jgi:hypothetical protein